MTHYGRWFCFPLVVPKFRQMGRSLGNWARSCRHSKNCTIAGVRQHHHRIIDAREFEKLWPRKDAQADAEWKHFLKKARRAPATSADAAPTRPKPRPASPDDLKARLKVTRFANYPASHKTALVG
jgi:hypothetical protein